MPQDFYLGKVERFSEIARSAVIDEVIIALPLRMEKVIIEMVERCDYEGIRVRIVPDFFRVIRNRAVLDRLGDIPFIGIRTEPLSLLKNRVLKRTFDIVFSLTALILLSPIFAIIAIIIKATSKGPVFFKQERMGANNVEFEIYKFRSMTVQAKEHSDTIWTTANDSRVTKIGNIMRKTNLDELAQFWNVLIGNMSVVGPRPEREHFVEQFKEEIHNYKVRHLVKSGITGWAQVNGWRGDTSIKKRVEHDIYYIENWSFWLDLKIIGLTLFGGQTQKHAY
jgi:Undecaprenyl-phosphate glucose phosphotransferase